jgi:hypothetical protein
MTGLFCIPYGGLGTSDSSPEIKATTSLLKEARKVVALCILIMQADEY